MANINSNQQVYLYTTVSGGIQPYDQCARWGGSYTASNGSTGPVIVSPGLIAGTPYIISTNTPCVVPGTSGGSLTGTLVANGFTGSISVWTNVADSSGIFKESNIKSYTALPSSALIVNAGPNQSIVGAGGPSQLQILGAGVTGGTPPYTYLWTQDWPGDNPERSYFSPGTPISGATANSQSTTLLPIIEEFSTDGIYYYQLTATDSLGQTGTDEMQVTVTGASPLPEPIPSAALSWSMSRTGFSLGTFRIERKRGSSVTYNFVTTGFSGTGTVSVGTSGLVAGDQIRISVSSFSGSLTGLGSNTEAYVQLNRTLRNPPYTLEVVQSDYDSQPFGADSNAIIPGAGLWYTVNPVSYWYDINADADAS